MPSGDGYSILLLSESWLAVSVRWFQCIRKLLLATQSFFLLAYVSPPNVLAAEEGAVEIGTSFGLTVVIPKEGSRDPEGVLSVPSGSVGGIPALYATLFASGSTAFEPQVSFRTDSAGPDFFLLACQLNQFLRPEARTSLYLGPTLGWDFFTGGNSPLFGGAVGIRGPIREAGAWRIELRYRNYTNELESHELALGVALGFLVSPGQTQEGAKHE